MYFFKTFFQFLEDNFFNASLNGNYEYLEINQTTTTLLMIVGGFCLGFIIAAFMIYFQKKTVGRFMRTLMDREAYGPEKAKSLDDLGFGTDKTVRGELTRTTVTRKMVGFVEGDTVYTYEKELASLFPDGIVPNEKPTLKARISALFRKKGSEDASVAEKNQALNEDSTEDKSQADPETDTESTAAKEKDTPTLAEDREKKEKAPLNERLLGKSFHLHRPDFAVARFFIPEELRYRVGIRFKNDANILWPILSLLASAVLFFLALKFIPVLVNMLDLSIGNIIG